jgi:hypothetical protein
MRRLALYGSAAVVLLSLIVTTLKVTIAGQKPVTCPRCGCHDPSFRCPSGRVAHAIQLPEVRPLTSTDQRVTTSRGPMPSSTGWGTEAKPVRWVMSAFTVQSALSPSPAGRFVRGGSGSSSSTHRRYASFALAAASSSSRQRCHSGDPGDGPSPNASLASRNNAIAARYRC